MFLRNVVPGVIDLGERAALPVPGKLLFDDADGSVDVLLRIQFGGNLLGLRVFHAAAAPGKGEQKQHGQKQG